MKNKELGLPYSEDGMEKILVAFDVDGTLIDNERVHANMLQMLVSFLTQKWKNVDVIVWSGGGADYARVQLERRSDFFRGRNIWHSKLEYDQLRKKYDKVIAFDDIQDTRLGDVNLIVRNK
jgi:phosphoglycolate phosphatase-like HAD superfamily hydrolase